MAEWTVDMLDYVTVGSMVHLTVDYLVDQMALVQESYHSLFSNVDC